MELEELQNYRMRGKTFTIVDKQNKKKTIKVGEDYPFTLEVVEIEDNNLCSCYITILQNNTDTVYTYEIEEILESQSCVLVIVYQVNIGGNKWLEASTLEDLLEDVTSTNCLFIPDKKLGDRTLALSNPRGYLTNKSNEGKKDKFGYQLVVEV